MTNVEIDRSQVLDDLSAMIRCVSVNPFGLVSDHTAEADMADLFERQMQDLGLETDSHVVSPSRRNVWGTLKGKGTGPTILLAGHLDTVGVEGYPDAFEPIISQGRIHGRGSCDMKAGLAAYLEVVRCLKRLDAPLKGDVIIAGVVDEEHAMAGSSHFGKHGPQADAAIVAEPSQLKISACHKGQVLTTIRTTGLAAHSSMPENGRNAIYHMSYVLGALQDYARDVSRRTPDPVCGAPSFSVGVIRGGDNACSVPDICEIDIDRRTIPGETSRQVLLEIDAVLNELSQKVPQLQYQIDTPFLDLPPLNTKADSALMQAMVSACKTVTGTAEVVAFPGSTDAPNYNCPTVICGPGNLEQCHSLNEYVSIAEIEDAVRLYVTAILNMQSSN